MLLLDTQLLLWAAFEPERLSARARRLIEPRQQRLAFSHVSLWEVAIKQSLRRPGFAVEPAALHAALLQEGFEEIAIQPQHLFAVATLPWLHRDPFDRLLVCQAAVEQLTLLSADPALKAYGGHVRPV